MNIIFKDGKITFEEEKVIEKTPIDLFIQMEIPKEIIDKCDSESILQRKTLFIFDKKVNTFIGDKSNYYNGIIFDSDDFFISDIYGFTTLPSRIPYYDSEIKIVNINTRYDFAYKFLYDLEFIPSEYNLGSMYEQNFSNANFSIKMMPNLFIIVTDRSNLSIKYNGYFNKNEIINLLTLEDKREFKLKKIIKEE